jgi:polyhydroxybutyrate depolymerase
MIAIILIGFVLVYGVSVKMAAKQSFDGGTSQHSIQIDGLTRTYLVHIPHKYFLGKRVAVVIMLHGAGGNAENGLEQGKWIEKSEQEGFIAVGLNGTLKDPSQRPNLLTNPRVWNAGDLIVSDSRGNVDDVGFVNAVIDKLLQTGMVDQKRIYVTGFSNGAGMTFRVGVELSNRIAAIAPVSNTLLITTASLKQPVSLILIWGTADPINPINGGIVTRFGQLSVRHSAEYSWKTWGGFLNCSGNSKIIYEQRGVVGKTLSPCQTGAEALFYSVEGMGHNWPGGRNNLPEKIVGRTSNAIDATDLIWEFFAKHNKV